MSKAYLRPIAQPETPLKDRTAICEGCRRRFTYISNNRGPTYFCSSTCRAAKRQEQAQNKQRRVLYEVAS